jgi:pimeloyl-ACP methyl ester carboxylesterase
MRVATFVMLAGRRLPSLGLVALSAAMAASVGRAAEPPQQEATTIRSFDGRTLEANVLRVSVPERRLGDARRITLTGLRIPTTAASPGPPLVFLMGGPGIPATVMAPVPPYFSLFARLRELADVVLVDQRGIGKSEPTLDCPVSEGLPTDAFLLRRQLVAALSERVGACASTLRSQGVEPSAYTTVESADDLDDVRKALGTERIDILAFSYGTRLALAYLQRHEAHVGRMVLQGVNGPGLVLKRPSAIDAKLTRISDLLKADPAWTGATDLALAARAARIRLAKTPAAIEITDRRTSQPRSLRVGRDGFDLLIALNVDDIRLPALLVSVAAGDNRVLRWFVEAAWNGLGAGSVGLMGRVVNCAADRPARRVRLVAEEARRALFANPIDNEFLTDEFCHGLGRATPSMEFPQPVRSSVPVLLVTGSLDATNPVTNAVEVAAGLTNAVLVTVDNAAHEALPITAVQDLVVDWYRGVDVRGRQVAATPPTFTGVEEAAKAPPSRR